MAVPLKGRLLVATPVLDDPNFDRTVVWLLEHGDEGALGVVLNRPSTLTVAEPLPGWADLAEPLPVVFVGGPVSSSSVIGLAQVTGEVPAGAWEPVAGTVGVVDLTTDPMLVSPAITALRCFAGYAGWGAGQLEEELEEQSWVVLPARASDVFTTAPDMLWAEVLRRNGGGLAVLALLPEDPHVN